MRRMYDQEEIKDIAAQAGGEAKLYLHKIIAHFSDHPGDIYLTIINNSNTPITENSQLKTYIGSGLAAYYNGSEGTGAVGISVNNYSTNEFSVQGAVANDSSSLASIKFRDVFGGIDDNNITEL